MFISLGNGTDLVNFKTVQVPNADALAKIIVESPYCLSTFKNGYRKKENFSKAEAIGLDFDEGVTLAEATELFKEYSHIIAPSRSHQIEKNGVVCDRFRVVLFLSTPITDNETFEATWFSLFAKYPKLDKACKDSSRFFYPSQSIHSIVKGGLKVEPVEPKKPEPKERKEIPVGHVGELGKKTLKFLLEGAPEGQRHNELYAAARDAHQQGYSEEWFVQKIETLCSNIGDDAYQDKGALKAISDAFTKEPKHEPRLGPPEPVPAFHLVRLGELFKEEKPIDWLVDSLMYRGGLSVLVGPPKTGKSTIARQLIQAIIRGGTFLDRKCQQGSVDYYAIEEHINVLISDFRRLELSNDDNLSVHVGHIESDNQFDAFRANVVSRKPDFVIVDTMFDIIQVENNYDYQQVKKALLKLSSAAKEANCHILMVHHSNKGNGEKRRGNDSILGSTAIAGGVDTVIVLEREMKERFITTSGRHVLPWEYRSIIWDKKTGTYSIGPDNEVDQF